MLSRISFNGNGERLRPFKVWEELYLTYNGIFKDASQICGHQIISSPDLSLVSIHPEYLIFAEVKPNLGCKNLEKMLSQLKVCHDYVNNNPDILYSFLISEGLSEELIENFTIGFLGVKKTKYGIREIAYYQF